MAEQPIKHGEIIEEKVFQPAADSADVLLEKLSLLIGGFRELAKITGAKINSGIDPKTISDVDKLAQAKEKLSHIEKGLNETERVQAEVMLRTRKARQDLNDQLKSQGGLLGNLIIKKKQLGLDLLSAKTTDEIKKINQELFKTNGQIRNIKEGGVQSFNSWGNAIQSFQFKFNSLGNLIGGFALSLLSSIGSFITQTETWKGATELLKDVYNDITDAIGLTSNALDKLESKRLENLKIKTERVTAAEQHRLDVLNALGEKTIEMEITAKQSEVRRLIADAQYQLSQVKNQNISNDVRKKAVEDFKETKKLIKEGNDDIDILKAEKTKRDKDALLEFQKDKTDINVEGNEKNLEANKKAESDKEEKDRKDARDKAQKEAEDDREKAKEEKIKQQQDQLDNAKKFEEDFFEELKELSDKELKLNQEKISAIEKEEDFQRQLALEGEKNNYAELKKEKAQALEEQAKLEKKAAREREAEKFVEIFLEFYKTYAKEGDKAFGKALKSTMMAIGGKMIAKGLAGAFAEGVEDLKGKGTGTSDSNVALLSKGESVTTAKGTSETKGLVTAVNKDGFLGAKEWAMQNIFPKIPIQDKSRSEQLSESLLSVLHSDIKELQKTIKDKKELHIHRNILGELVIGEKENGIHNQTTQKNTPIIYTR